MNNIKYISSLNFLGFSAYGENYERLIFMCACLWYIEQSFAWPILPENETTLDDSFPT
jgi:hypothetical protein